MFRAQAWLIHLTEDDALGADAAVCVASAAGETPAAVSSCTNLLRQVVETPAAVRKRFGAGDVRMFAGCRRPRAVQALLAYAGVERPAERITWVTVAEGAPEPAGGARRGPWYPVIDAARCTNCGQCFSYCLFGVYARDDPKRVTVCHPLNCKPGCPACARICPAVAIIFPLSPESPINGDPVTAGARRVAVDLEKHLGADPLKVLSERRQRVLDMHKVAAALAERERRSALAQSPAKPVKSRNGAPRKS